MTEPEDPLVTLREVPARRMAAVRYSGTWSERGYRRNLEKLEVWFLRRNEILVPVAAGAD